MDLITALSFFTRNRIILVCVCVVIISVVAYFESVPNQTTGRSVDDRIKAAYFTIRNSIFSEPEGDEWYGEYKKHTIYKKFKTMYPESTDEFSFTTNGTPVLRVYQYDNHGNVMDLTLLKCGGMMPFCYDVSCLLYGNASHKGVPFEPAFEFLDSAECLLD